MLLAGRDVAHDDARLGVLALEPHEMARERHVEEDHDARPVRHEVAPVLAAGRASGAVTILKSSAPSALVQDDELGRRDARRVYADAGVAARDEARPRVRVGAVEEPDLRGLVVADARSSTKAPDWVASMSTKKPARVSS